ncbi:nucleic-acid-binding protein from transposon X-element [Nephila pilipes]|uniref:Nucleic-acid-binding protein from transposon X-element n=1 Tax=Nephila pilipes TaxID=299642 RepID=A0A8X6T8P1_NEPPI|nr:nucleic-acid-binding protein from transposon X-element [Nephila pilipes]
MPLFLITLEKNEENKTIYNLGELCYCKIRIESQRKRVGPALCFRCQGFYHNSNFCTRDPKCVKCGDKHLTAECKNSPETPPTCCHCGENHPANFSGCKTNPLNKPPPPPKINVWEERKKKERNSLLETIVNKPQHLR